jgi:hypothetical protein
MDEAQALETRRRRNPIEAKQLVAEYSASGMADLFVYDPHPFDTENRLDLAKVDEPGIDGVPHFACPPDGRMPIPKSHRLDYRRMSGRSRFRNP